MGEETKYQKLDPSAVKCMRINSLIAGVFLLIVEIIIICILGPGETPVWLWITFTGLLLLYL